jgi:hypothetical protein
LLYVPDDGTVGGREDVGEWGGVRVRRGERAEVIVRALEPIERMHVMVEPGEGAVEACVDGACDVIAPGQARAEATFEPSPGLLYYDTFLYVLELRSTAEPGAGVDGGPGVSLMLEVERRDR